MNDRARLRMLVLAAACASVTCGCIDAVTDGVTEGITEAVSDAVVAILDAAFDRVTDGG
jgi:hypothetical protein